MFGMYHAVSKACLKIILNNALAVHVMIVTRIFSPSPIYILFREENNFEQWNNWNLSILLTLLLLFFLIYYFWIMPPCLDSMFLFNSPFEEITTNITYYSLYSIPAPIEILLLHIFSLSSKRVLFFLAATCLRVFLV